LSVLRNCPRAERRGAEWQAIGFLADYTRDVEGWSRRRLRSHAAWALLCAPTFGSGCGEASSEPPVSHDGGPSTALDGSAVEPGELAACSEVEVDDEPGIVVIVNGETIEFRRDVLWYGGRPPTLDLIAFTETVGWTSFRIFIDPEEATVVPREYRSEPGNVTYVAAVRDSGQYDTVDNDASTICVTESGTSAGARVAGTFQATLATDDESRSFTASGTFSGVIGP
jgi:hypothetical protein